MGRFERQPLRAEEAERKNKEKRNRWIRLALLVLFVLAAVLLVRYWLQHRHKTYTGYEITTEQTLDLGLAANYLAYNGGFLRVTHDGAQAMGGDGELLWNVSYTMAAPEAAVCEGCAVVGDIGKNTVYVMDGTGIAYDITLTGAVQEVEVANQGVAAIRTNDGEQDHIYLYRKDGTQLVDILTIQEKHGFPIDIALSNDGTKLVTVYLVVKGDKLTTQLTFYNFSEVGQSYVDDIVGSFQYDGLIGKAEFLENNTVCAYTDQGFLLYAAREIPSLTKELTFEAEIRSIVAGEAYICAVVENTAGLAPYRVQLYDRNGALVLNQTIETEYDSLVVCKEELIFYHGGAVEIWWTDGKLKLKTAFSQRVKQLFPVSGLNRYALLCEDAALTIQLITKEEV